MILLERGGNEARGLAVTFELTIMAVSFGFVLGLLLAIGRVYGNRVIQLLSGAYLTFFRGTPMLVQIFIAYYGLPAIGIKMSNFGAGLLALTLNSAAYQAEYFRGSILAVREDEIVAVRALGMTSLQAIRHVVIPQTLRMVIPAWSNQVVNLLKFSSLVYLIRVPELMYQGRLLAMFTYRNLEIFLIVAAMYLGTVLFLSQILGILERKVRIPGLSPKGL